MQCRRPMITPFIFAFWICVKLGGSPRIKGTTPVAGLVCSRCAISFLFGCDGTIAPCALGYRFSVLSATSYKTMEDVTEFQYHHCILSSSIRHTCGSTIVCNQLSICLFWHGNKNIQTSGYIHLVQVIHKVYSGTNAMLLT